MISEYTWQLSGAILRHLGFFSWSQVSLSMCCISGHLPQRNTAVVSFVSSRKARLCGEVRCVTKLRTVVQQTISRGYGAVDMKGVFLLSKMIFKRGSSGGTQQLFSLRYLFGEANITYNFLYLENG